ncbi:MAG: hypothetical protein P0Y55_00845 [Candidatus Cohnella colombiensis]|uniref:Cytochrome c oxidase subunit 2A n=1 Tax=Candidatus Cohnella colombiensis TaxID=3121368 RepID=A0AA95JG84_9BACL|nr:MAG: hypothetical protein P0Y55_00845 [Cohnella sp.]
MVASNNKYEDGADAGGKSKVIGTIISVAVVGLTILAVYLLVFGLYMARI